MDNGGGGEMKYKMMSVCVPFQDSDDEKVAVLAEENVQLLEESEKV